MFSFGKKKTVYGITSGELSVMREKIRVEYADTAEKHKKPTEYMRGLQFALDVIDYVETHEL